MNRLRWGALAVAAAVILVWPSVSQAQRFWRGGWRGDGGWRGRTAFYYGDGAYYPYYVSYGPRWYRSGYYYPAAYTYQPASISYQSGYPPDYAFDTMPANQGNRVLANIRVPEASAQLWIEGQEMTTQGLVRSFVSPPLDPGRYTYSIRAQWTDNGKPMEATRQVPVRPGQRVRVDFTVPERSPAPRTQRQSGYGPDEGIAAPRNEEKGLSPRTKPTTPPPQPERPRDENKTPDRQDNPG